MSKGREGRIEGRGGIERWVERRRKARNEEREIGRDGQREKRREGRIRRGENVQEIDRTKKT